MVDLRWVLKTIKDRNFEIGILKDCGNYEYFESESVDFKLINYEVSI